MKLERSAGILLHPTSFPSRFGIGGLGKEAYEFVDFLEESGMKLWQTLAMGPTGYGDSPYAALSAFAGNFMLVDPEKIVNAGDLKWEDINNPPAFPRFFVDYGWVNPYKEKLFRKAASNFRKQGSTNRRQKFEKFCEEHSYWLEDFSLFMALKAAHDLKIWNSWEMELVKRDEKALAEWRKKLSDDVFYYKYIQWQFWVQWTELKEYANSKEIEIIGDIPIFVAQDSADVWANPDLFYLDEEGKQVYVAGVPPDYFSETGQRWGNPLYRWDKMQEKNFFWWTARIKHQLELVDYLRIDHFRGFEAYWEIPASEPTAVKGRWVKAPGQELFEHLRKELGELPIIAEDLGVITEEVTNLRQSFDMPGMKVLQFAFEGADNFLPHNFERNFIVYSGSHDNNTSVGWYNTVSDEARENFRSYTGSNGEHVSWDFFRLALMSIADIAILPLQDILELGEEARMNTPGKERGNWQWRYWEGALTETLAEKIRNLTEIYERKEVENKENE